MMTAKTYTFQEAADFMGLRRQAVVNRNTRKQLKLDANGKVPHAQLIVWQKERQARARKLLASPDLRNGQ